MLMHEYGPKTHRVTYIQAGLRGRHACMHIRSFEKYKRAVYE